MLESELVSKLEPSKESKAIMLELELARKPLRLLLHLGMSLIKA